jgi:hypothetical protein
MRVIRAMTCLPFPVHDLKTDSWLSADFFQEIRLRRDRRGPARNQSGESV